MVDNEGMDTAEVTLLYHKVKYRDNAGIEKEAIKFHRWAKVKFANIGEEQVYDVPVDIVLGLDGAVREANHRFFLQEHPGHVPEDGTAGLTAIEGEN